MVYHWGFKTHNCIALFLNKIVLHNFFIASRWTDTDFTLTKSRARADSREAKKVLGQLINKFKSAHSNQK